MTDMISFGFDEDGDCKECTCTNLPDPTPDGWTTIKLDFIKPFEGHNTAEFTMLPQGDSTNVTWAMYGPNPYIAKVMQSVFNMDEMIGKDFADGLANLKTAAEK